VGHVEVLDYPEARARIGGRWAKVVCWGVQMADNKGSLLPGLPFAGGLPADLFAPAAQAPALGFDLAAILESVAKNPRDRVYKNQDVFLDGYTFTNCCFINCVLYTDTGMFVLKSCTVMQDCQILLGPAALRIVKLFNLRFYNQNAPWPVYNAVNEPHGSITLE